MFILCINDIVNVSNILKFILFADDTNVIYSNKDLSELTKSLNSELLVLADWFKANKLSLNIQKTSFMLFGNQKIVSSTRNNISNESLSFRLDNKISSRVTESKFLGVIIDLNRT